MTTCALREIAVLERGQKGLFWAVFCKKAYFGTFAIFVID